MGLRADIELVFPEVLEEPQADISIEIDYSEAWDTFERTFNAAINQMCPVRTGYLKSTIGGNQTSDTTYEVYADAEYAQYVEYGTYKMSAQPYFEPAIRRAISEARDTAQEIYEEAEEEFQEELEAWKEEQMEEAAEEGGGGSPTTMGASSIFTSIIIILAQALCQAIMNGLKELFSTEDRNKKTKGGGSYSGALTYDVEIT